MRAWASASRSSGSGSPTGRVSTPLPAVLRSTAVASIDRIAGDWLQHERTAGPLTPAGLEDPEHWDR